jgi:pimeloyl-ACP methyl ester carboxylesterase
MQLATLDPNSNVVYLARPCQYSPLDLKTVCDSKYWSLARYSQEVVSALDSAISQIKLQYHAKQLNLIGYSGGGALAILIASQRADIASIRTVAGNLDLYSMDKIHDTTPLSESLDPLAVAKQVRHIPQLHFVGGKDHIVPEIVAKNFVKEAGLDANAVVVINKASHNTQWDKHWPQLLQLECVSKVK